MALQASTLGSLRTRAHFEKILEYPRTIPSPKIWREECVLREVFRLGRNRFLSGDGGSGVSTANPNSFQGIVMYEGMRDPDG